MTALWSWSTPMPSAASWSAACAEPQIPVTAFILPFLIGRLELLVVALVLLGVCLCEFGHGASNGSPLPR